MIHFPQFSSIPYSLDFWNCGFTGFIKLRKNWQYLLNYFSHPLSQAFQLHAYYAAYGCLTVHWIPVVSFLSIVLILFYFGCFDFLNFTNRLFCSVYWLLIPSSIMFVSDIVSVNARRLVLFLHFSDAVNHLLKLIFIKDCVMPWSLHSIFYVISWSVSIYRTFLHIISHSFQLFCMLVIFH